MKKTVLFVLGFLCLVSFLNAQFWTLDFESAGGYTTSIPEFTDGSADFWIRTDGSDHGSYVVYTGVIGSYYFAGMDIDGEGATLPVFIDIDDIDISGQTNVELRIYLAEDQASDAFEDWDDSDYVHIYYDIDNSGSFSNLLWIENDGSQYNSAPYIDTDFDGTGDGTEITDTFVQFTASILGTGSLLDIQIEFYLNSGDEDIALDNLQLFAAGGPSAPLIIHTAQGNTTSTSAITINADITDADTDLTTTTGSAPSCWYRIDGGSWTWLEDTTPVIDTFSWDIPGQSTHTLVEYYLAAQDDASNVTTSPAGGGGTTPPGNTPPASFHTYNVLKSSPTIYDVQNYRDGSDNSYYSGETVSLTGIVTGIYGTSDYVIQDGAGAWNGIWVHTDGNLLSQGDNVTVDATVAETNNLTQLTTVTGTTTNSTGNPLPTVSTILTGDLDESYEGVYVFMDDATCTDENPDAPSDYGEWEITSTASTACRVDDLGYLFEPTLNNVYDVTAIGYYSYGNYKLEPRDAGDIVLESDIIPPEISSVSVTDENTVEVNFDEDVEETTAETTTHYTIVARDVTVTGAVLDIGDASHVTLTVTGMTFGDYTLTVVGVEDLSGNPSDDSENFSYYLPADVLINEVDADDVLTDDLEFIELYDGGIGNTDLTGLVVVLFNGSDDASYLPVTDLDGYSTDANGYFVIGDALVPNVDLVMSNGFLQNGADAVAIFVGNGVDFPDNTPVNITNLIDALVYDTNDADDPGLLVLLNAGQPQINEGERGNKDEHSNQRIPNGSGGQRNTDTYYQAIPTPGAENQIETPDAPTDVIITVNGNDIDLNWPTVFGATSYIIYRSTDPYNFGSTAHDTSVTNSYTDIGAASGVKYFYRVTATN